MSQGSKPRRAGAAIRSSAWVSSLAQRAQAHTTPHRPHQATRVWKQSCDGYAAPVAARLTPAVAFVDVFHLVTQGSEWTIYVQLVKVERTGACAVSAQLGLPRQQKEEQAQHRPAAAAEVGIVGGTIPGHIYVSADDGFPPQGTAVCGRSQPNAAILKCRA